jgi:hypothetical protein
MSQAIHRAEARIRYDVVEYNPSKGYQIDRRYMPRSNSLNAAKHKARELAAQNPGVFYEVFRLVGVAFMEPIPTKAEWAEPKEDIEDPEPEDSEPYEDEF